MVYQNLDEDYSFICAFNEAYRDGGAYDDDQLWAYACDHLIIRENEVSGGGMPDWTVIFQSMVLSDLIYGIQSFLSHKYQKEFKHIGYDDEEVLNCAEAIASRFIDNYGNLSFLGDSFPIVDEMTANATDAKMVKVMEEAIGDYVMNEYLEDIPEVEPTQLKTTSAFKP